jgi:hypothetical protein
MNEDNNTAELDYKVMKWTEHFVLLLRSTVLTKQYNVMVNSDEVIDTTEYLLQ